MEEELRFPEWQKPYRDAMLEFGEEKLPEKLKIAKAAIYQRLEALAGDSNHHEERQAINDALNGLNVLRNGSDR